MDIRNVRKSLRREYGDRKYRITSAGEIHVHGIMPNTNSVGWYLWGRVGDRDTEVMLETINEINAA